MIEILDGIASLEIKGEGTKRILILCDRLERWDYGIIGFKILPSILFSNKREQVIIIHTNVIKESEKEWKSKVSGTGSIHMTKQGESINKADFNSIKEVLDSLGIIIHWKVNI